MTKTPEKQRVPHLIPMIIDKFSLKRGDNTTSQLMHTEDNILLSNFQKFPSLKREPVFLYKTTINRKKYNRYLKGSLNFDSDYAATQLRGYSIIPFSETIDNNYY